MVYRAHSISHCRLSTSKFSEEISTQGSGRGIVRFGSFGGVVDSTQEVDPGCSCGVSVCVHFRCTLVLELVCKSQASRTENLQTPDSFFAAFLFVCFEV